MVTPLRDEAGSLLGFTKIGRDLTEKKLTEESRLEIEERYRVIAETASDAIITIDEASTILFVNPAAGRIFGYSPQELKGASLAMLMPDYLRHVHHAGIKRYAETGKKHIPWTGVELPALHKSGREIPVEISFGEFAGEGRRFFTGIIRDIGARKRAESIGTLAGGVAHDFNNLLTAILGNTQLALRKISPDDPVHDRLIEVEKAGNRATSLTRQLLAFSRRQRLERKTLNLNDTINDIMKMLKRIIGEDVEVRVQEVGYLSPVFADPAQIEQVVMNLAVNARDAMPGGGKLIIETRNVTLDEAYRREHPYAKTGKYVQMIVSDTGTGMDAETKGRIFEPFFTTKEAGKGAGLGLSMVFGIVKQHGGMVEVESETGQGTTFHIYLPIDEKSVKEEAPDVLLPMRGGTEMVLVAEDEESLRGLARSILEELGYTVLLAKDGVEALEIYEANREGISLVLLDIVMPRMGGREAYERISQLGGAIPVLFMTGYSAEIVQYEFVKQNKFIEEAGAVLMQKPYSVETLGRKVREVLDAARKL